MHVLFLPRARHGAGGHEVVEAAAPPAAPVESH
jgi:hypothetical protein